MNIRGFKFSVVGFRFHGCREAVRRCRVIKLVNVHWPKTSKRDSTLLRREKSRR